MKNISIRLNFRDINDITDLDPKSVSGYTERWAQALMGIRKMTFVSLKGYFAENELKFLLDQGNGRNFDPVSALKIENLKFNIQDACRLDKLDEKWKVDTGRLLKKMENMTPMQVYFLNDWVDLFWNGKRERTKEQYIVQLL